jgi:glycosyltransferase involved in cell wall biosynthesis
MRSATTGLLVPPNDLAAMVGAIGRLLRDPALAAKLGEAGRRLIEEKFSEEKMLDGVESLLLSLRQEKSA